MVKFLLSFIVSFIVNLLIIKLSSRIDRLVTDHLHDGPQKFHDRPTPRIGGVGVFIAFSLAAFYAQVSENNNYLMLLISSLPVFLFGVLEDVLKKISPKVRLLAAALSALLVYLLLNVYLTRIGIPYLDNIFEIKLIALCFTIFCIAGVANAINIIDGYNGLASVVSMIIFLL